MNSLTTFVLNGETVSVESRPDMTVLDLLRDQLGRKGTKEGCAEGDCGACTILFHRPDSQEEFPRPANACIMTVAQIEAGEITTVEGIGNGALSDLQARMAENGSSQCGYCTPGIVMALSGLLARNSEPNDDDIHDAMAGNLCRCTGYKPIVDAAKAALANGVPRPNGTQSLHAQATVSADGSTAMKPSTVEELLTAKKDHPASVLLAGGTDLAVSLAAYETQWPQIILTGSVTELRELKVTDHAFQIGAAVTWEELMDAVSEDYPSFATLIKRFGSTQIRSMGTVGGNVGTASPIGDGPPAMIALGATITLQSLARGKRTLPLEDFFLDYRKTELAEDEIIAGFSLPRIEPDQFFRSYKISKRYDQDISTVCGAFNLMLDGDLIVEARIAYGGMAATPKRASNAEAAITGKALSDQTASDFAQALMLDFAPLTDWRGTDTYRMRVAQGLFARLVADHAGKRVEVMAG
ncbi:MAG: xanthine dehydrogenase small subunit [Pseudomonadota bacterium]